MYTSNIFGLLFCFTQRAERRRSKARHKSILLPWLLFFPFQRKRFHGDFVPSAFAFFISSYNLSTLHSNYSTVARSKQATKKLFMLITTINHNLSYYHRDHESHVKCSGCKIRLAKISDKVTQTQRQFHGCAIETFFSASLQFFFSFNDFAFPLRDIFPRLCAEIKRDFH